MLGSMQQILLLNAADSFLYFAHLWNLPPKEGTTLLDPFPIAVVHFELPRRGQPLNKKRTTSSRRTKWPCMEAPLSAPRARLLTIQLLHRCEWRPRWLPWMSPQSHSESPYLSRNETQSSCHQPAQKDNTMATKILPAQNLEPSSMLEVSRNGL